MGLHDLIYFLFAVSSLESIAKSDPVEDCCPDLWVEHTTYSQIITLPKQICTVHMDVALMVNSQCDVSANDLHSMETFILNLVDIPIKLRKNFNLMTTRFIDNTTFSFVSIEEKGSVERFGFKSSVNAGNKLKMKQTVRQIMNEFRLSRKKCVPDFSGTVIKTASSVFGSSKDISENINLALFITPNAKTTKPDLLPSAAASLRAKSELRVVTVGPSAAILKKSPILKSMAGPKGIKTAKEFIPEVKQIINSSIRCITTSSSQRSRRSPPTQCENLPYLLDPMDVSPSGAIQALYDNLWTLGNWVVKLCQKTACLGSGGTLKDQIEECGGQYPSAQVQKLLDISMALIHVTVNMREDFMPLVVMGKNALVNKWCPRINKKVKQLKKRVKKIIKKAKNGITDKPTIECITKKIENYFNQCIKKMMQLKNVIQN